MGKILTADGALRKAVGQIKAMGWQDSLMVQELNYDTCDQLIFSYTDSQGQRLPIYTLQSTCHDGQEYWYAMKRNWITRGFAMELDEALMLVWQYVIVLKIMGVEA